MVSRAQIADYKDVYIEEMTSKYDVVGGGGGFVDISTFIISFHSLLKLSHFSMGT